MSKQAGQSKWSLGTVALIILLVVGVAGVALMAIPDLMASEQQATVVQAAQDLPPLTVISATNLTTGTAPLAQAAGAVTDAAQAVGKVTTGAVSKGATLEQATLLALPADAWLLSAPVSGTIPPAIGDTVALLGVRPGTDKAVVAAENGVVVTVDGQSALVAVTRDEAGKAAAFLVDPNRLVIARRFGSRPASVR